jgi:hypothetical protein
VTNIHQMWEANSLLLPRDVTNTDVSVGDPLALAADGSEVITGSEETWDTDTATTRRNFVQKYAGDCAQEADAAEYIIANGDALKSKVRVNTAGVRRIDSPADGTYVAGVTLVGLKKASGNNLEDDVFEIVTDEREATHRVVYTPLATNPDWVLGQILSRKFAHVAPNEAVLLHQYVLLAGITNADVLTNFTPGFAGDIIGFDFIVTSPVTTAAKTAALNLEIGTTDVTGGVLTITSAAATPLGKVISATAITANNSFDDDDTISIEATAVTAFSEGTGTLLVKMRKRGG